MKESILDIFRDTCFKYEKKIAIIHNEKAITYSELDQRSDELASHLIEYGCPSGSTIGLYFDRSVEFIVSILACIKAKLIYVPLSHEYPYERLEYLIRSSDIRCIVSSSAEPFLGKVEAKIVKYAIGMFEVRKSELIRAEMNSLEDVCIIFTSGSTGYPKGISVKAKGILRLVRSPNYIQISDSDVISHASNISFDAINFEIWAAFLNGATLSIADKEIVISPDLYKRYLENDSVSILFLTTRLFNLHIKYSRSCFYGVRYVLFGGEAANASLLKEYICRNPHLPENLLNVYGPTECTTFATYYLVPKDSEIGDVLPIGKPISATIAYVVDEEMAQVGKNKIGQIILGGEGLASGYVNNDELNSAKFITCSFHAGERFYATGDLGYFDNNGNLVYVCRSDRQFKVNGYLIEPNEIERVILKYKKVAGVYVSVNTNENKSNLIVAYIVLDGDKFSLDELKDILDSDLPLYMMPTNFKIVNEIPLNGNGKVDVKALEDMCNDLVPSADLQVNFAMTSTEELLVGLIHKISRIRVSDHDVSLFDYGFDSLLIFRLCGEIQDKFGAMVGVADLIKLSSVRAISKFIDQGECKSGCELIVPKSSCLVTSVPSLAQRRLWVLYKLNSTLANYNEIIIFRISGPLDVTRLERALNKLIYRHQALRSKFYEEEGSPNLILENEPKFVVNVNSSLRVNESQDYASEMECILARISRFKFELSKWPLFTVDVYELEHNENILIFNFSHVIIDGWSLSLFFQELSRLYLDINYIDENYNKVEYFDYTRFVSDTKRVNLLQGQAEYWKKYLKGYNGFFRKNEYVSYGKYDAHTKRFSLVPELTRKLDEIRKKLNITTSAILMSAYAIMLFEHIEHHDVLIAMPTANRRIGQSEKLIGFIANTVPIRIKNLPMMLVASYLKNTADSIYLALDNQDISYDEIVMLRDSSSVDRLSEFNPFFVMQNNESYELHISNTKVEEQDCQFRLAKFDILLSAREKHGNISIELTCRSQKFNCDDMDSMVGTLLKVIDGFSSSLHSEMNSLYKLVNIGELKVNTKFNLAGALNGAFSDFYDKIAVIEGCDALTYHQIDQLSNQLAHYLIARGLKDADLLGVYSRNGLYFVIALIACIKLNVTFMPLDSDYPIKYLEKMIEVSGVEVIVSLCEPEVTQTPQFITHQVDKNDLFSYSKENDFTQPCISSPLYLIFTSGSTGEPKCIKISHDVIENLLEFQMYSLNMIKYAKTLQYSPINFDVAIQEILTALCFGGSLVLIDSEIRRDNIKLINYIIEKRVERIILPYVKLQSLSSACSDVDRYPNMLREIISTGEQMICSPSIKMLFEKQNMCRIFNMYGPSETHAVTFYELNRDVSSWPDVSPLGTPISRTKIYVVNSNGDLCLDGEPGEICIAGLAAKYSYVSDKYKNRYGFLNYLGEDIQVYKTGDFGFKDAFGQYNFVCREDKQYKVSGYMINTSYIESVMLRCIGVRDVSVEVCDESNFRYIHAYILPQKINAITVDLLREYAFDNLPFYMRPSKITLISEIPYTLSGKLDRKRLIANNELIEKNLCLNQVEVELLRIFSSLLNVGSKNLDDNFFELGAGSLILASVHAKIHAGLCARLELLDLFRHTTIRKLASYIIKINDFSKESEVDGLENSADIVDENDNDRIAVIGISGKFPGADNVFEFWQNTTNKSDFMNASTMIKKDSCSNVGSRYIYRSSTMNGIFKFEPEYFGISEREASLMDPQHRHFLIGVVEALDSTYYDYRSFKGKIGVVGSCAENTYNSTLDKRLCKEKNSISNFQWAIASEKDFIATKASYYLNLRGPSYTIQSACSSSLVSIHVACSQLRGLESDLVVVGAVSIDISSFEGYEYKEGHIYSADGYCRPFDVKSSGTYAANGCGFVVLKLLRNAIKDGDKIYSIIEGSSLNNDGRSKVGFTAPSVDGQVDVISSAIENAGVSPSSVAYIEAHGTATKIGDAIEIAALKRVYSREFTSVKSLAVTSLKSQIGHMAAAAGIAGFIRAVLAIYYKKIPVSSNFTSINPNIDIEDSSIFINSETRDWEAYGHPRYAGVSSFGVGGTNAHVVLSDRYVIRSQSMNDDRIMRRPKKKEMKDYNLLPLCQNLQSKQMREPIEKWLYSPIWVKRNKKTSFVDLAPRIKNNYVVIVDAGTNSLVKRIISNLRKGGNNVVIVRLEENLEFISVDCITIDKNKFDCYVELLKYLSQYIKQFVVLYFPMLGVSSANYQEGNLVDLRCSTYYPILFFVKAYDAQFQNRKLSLMTFSRNLYSVSGDETLDPWASLILGALRVFPLEYDYLTCKHIDLAYSDVKRLTSHDFQYLMYFCENFYKTPNLVALRNGFSWEQVIHPTDSANFPTNESYSIKVGGTYLITGGTGELGLEIARLILGTPGVNVILLSRSGVIVESCILSELMQMAAVSNAKIDVLKCDLSDYNDLKMALGLVLDKYSHIDGIINSAGVSDSGISLRKSFEDCEKVFKSKVDGLVYLDRLVDFNKLDFFVNFSSVASYFGEFGQFAYCSANAFLDEYSVYMDLKYPRTKCVSIAWDTWAEGGMATNANLIGELKIHQDREIHLGILRSEGRLVFTRAMNMDFPRLIVSTVNIKDRAKLRDSHTSEISKRYSDRPIADILNYIVALFEKHLGVRVTPDTNIFHNGGDSLMAVEFLADLNKSLSNNISLTDLLTSPTPSMLFNAKFANSESSYCNYQMLRQGSPSKKIFLVHPITGDIFCYLDISKQILPGYEVIGIFDPIIMGKTMHFESLVQKASWYAKQVKRCQPIGPYCLAGWSFGGLLVHEIARCLFHAGDEVSFLCIIDPPSLKQYRNSGTTTPPEDQEILRFIFPSDSLNRTIEGGDLRFEYMEKIKEATMKNLGLMNSYVAGDCFAERQILIIASMNKNTTLALEWERATCKRFLSYYVEGDHYTIMKKPCVDKLAEIINCQLAEIDNGRMDRVDSL